MNENQEKIAEQILNLLRGIPQGDTLEGISRWRLQSEYIEQSVDEVASVLEILIEKGLVEKHSVKGGKPFYKVRKDRS